MTQVLTVAVASAIREGVDYGTSIRRWGRRYPYAGYGGWFRDWLFREDAAPYNSFGNGSAMRVAAIGWAFADLDVVIREATKSAEVTHNHPEGIKGAQAVAAAILLARAGQGKDQIAALLSDRFGYDCTMGLSALQRQGGFDVTCQGTGPRCGCGIPPIDGFRGCRAQRRLVRWRCRHPGVHCRRDGRSALRRSAGRDPSGSTLSPGQCVAC